MRQLRDSVQGTPTTAIARPCDPGGLSRPARTGALRARQQEWRAMNARTVIMGLRLAGVLAALLVAASCGKKDLQLSPVTNQLPTVRITGAPIDSNEVCSPDPVQSCYSLTLHWVGYDPDGRVSSYLFAIDPPSEP